MNILLVEDDPAHADIVLRTLDGFRVRNRITHVTDGQAALDHLFGVDAGAGAPHAPPDLVLLDLRLPKVDGLEVLGRMKADDVLKRIPTVILTTSAAEGDLLRAYEGGAGSYLVKPVDFQKFQELLESFGFYWLGWNQFLH